jgi:hypothetical protein
MTDAGTPNADVHANTRVRMRPSRRYRNEPDSDEGRIDGSVEPTACNAVAPRARIAGVDTTAPPMPNIPDNTPVTTPTSNVRSTSSQDGIVGKVLGHERIPGEPSTVGGTLPA